MTSPEKIIQLDDRSFKPYLSEAEIQAAVKRVANQINTDYNGKSPLLIPILNGSFMFAAELMKELTITCSLSFVKVASYHGTSSANELTDLIGLNESIADKDVILVEDIIDSGHTLSKLLPVLQQQKPASLRIASLLLKPKALRVSLHADYIGLEIPNDFIVGFGLDYNGLGRNLRDIYVVV